MKLCEAMKKLDENPNKVFKNRYGVKLTAKDGWASIDGRTTFPMEDVWEEVKQPVTWQEAIQAWAENGKTIRVEFENGNQKQFDSPHKLNTICPDDINLGTWYIED